MDSQFKIALVGCGGMSKAWVDYAKTRPDTKIVAMVDIKEECARNAAERAEIDCGIFTDLETAIKTTGANVVFDVTIPESHHKVVLTSLKNGCHVFGEKPMATSMAEASEMTAAAAKTGKSYAVMQNRRYLPTIRKFRDLISSGKIGTPGFMCADFFLGPHFGGFRDAMESPLVLDMAIHTFDQARFIIGDDPVAVYCHEFNTPGSWYKGDACAICIFEFANGSVFCYRGSWCAEGCSTSWESSWRVQGSNGTACWDGRGDPVAEVVANAEGFTRKYDKVESSLDYKGKTGHAGCIEEMFSSVLESRKAETDCTDNIKSMAMVFAALESSRKKEKIKIVI